MMEYFILRCAMAMLAIFAVSISIVTKPGVYDVQKDAISDESLHLSIRSLKGTEDKRVEQLSNGGTLPIDGKRSLAKGGKRSGKRKKGGKPGKKKGGSKGESKGGGGEAVPCLDQCTDDDGLDGVFVCRPRGKSGKEWSTQCVDEEGSQVLQEKKGAVCGCCDEDGPTEQCPEVCNIENSAICTDDGNEGLYMCRAVGRGTFPPSPAPSMDVLSASPTMDALSASPTMDALVPLPRSIKNVCVPTDETLVRQLKGDRCGCCGYEDGVFTIGRENCPTEDDRCSASIFNAVPCDLDEDGTVEAGEGYYMCRFVGNPPRLKTVCVDDDDSLSIQLNGGECGICPEEGDADIVLHRVREHVEPDASWVVPN